MSTAQAVTPANVNPEKVMRYMWGYAPPLIIEAALKNKVFEVLTAGPLTVRETSRATGASERGLISIMNALVGLELLTKDDSRYALTPESAAFLVKGKSSYLGGMLGHTSTQLLPKWLDIENVVRSGKPAAHVNNPAEGPAFFEKFVADLFPFNYPAAVAGAEALGITRATAPVRVLDLAAGSGVWSIAIAQRSPKVSVAAVDWPDVLPVTRATVSRFGLSDRFSYIAGDLAEASFGDGYDIATLGHTLHSEGPERSKRLLRKTFHALEPGGTILIAEFLVDEERQKNLTGLLFDVNMLVNTAAGQTYSFGEIRALLEDAGFTNARLIPAPGPSPLIFANKPAERSRG